jgi:hypothetical protein
VAVFAGREPNIASLTVHFAEPLYDHKSVR